VRERERAAVLSAEQSLFASATRSVQSSSSLYSLSTQKMAKGGSKGGGKKGGGTKKAKDPNAPKRAMSAFFFWMQENRDKLKKPGMGVADVAKAAGAEWGKLTDKTKWEKKAEDDKKRYERDIAAYKAGQ